MESKPLETSLLRLFSPLDGLKLENLHALARKASLRDLSAGRVLYKEGDTDKRTYYLVSGTLELLQENRVVATLRGGTSKRCSGFACWCSRCSSSRTFFTTCRPT